MLLLVLPGIASGIAPRVAWSAEPSFDELCARLTAHQPSEDVAFKPGKDVYWRDVVPANIDGEDNQIELNDTVSVGIGLYQADQLNLPPSTPYSPDFYIGTAEVSQDGSVMLNGKRLTTTQIQFLCNEKHHVPELYRPKPDPLNNSARRQPR